MRSSRLRAAPGVRRICEFADHPVDRRGSYTKEALHVGFCGWSIVDLGVRVIERQVLLLELGEGGAIGLGRVGDRHCRDRVILWGRPGKKAQVNVKHIVTLTDAERTELQTFINSGSKLARKVKRAQILQDRSV